MTSIRQKTKDAKFIDDRKIFLMEFFNKIIRLIGLRLLHKIKILHEDEFVKKSFGLV